MYRRGWGDGRMKGGVEKGKEEGCIEWGWGDGRINGGGGGREGEKGV